MRHLMNEMRLERLRGGGEIVAPCRSFGMEPDVAVGGHGDAARLEGPPFAAVEADAIIIDRVAEQRPGQRALAPGSAAGPDRA